MQVVQSIDRGGLEMMSVDLAIALRRRGLRSTVLALTEGGRLESRLADAGVNFKLVGGARYWSPATQYVVARTLARLRPTAVHTHHLPSLLTTGPAARALGVPRIVHTEHAHLYLEESPRARRQLRWAASTADAVALVGSALKSYYVRGVGIPEARLHTVPNGVDTERFRPLPGDEVRVRRRAAGLPEDVVLVGAVGRLAAVKNYGLLLRAAARARVAGTTLAVAFIGDGEERENLERLARELGVASATTFLGWRSDVAELVGTLDILAVTSTSEALPLVVLEAMSAGVAVISTAVGEIPRVLGEDESGILIRSGEEDELAGALVRLARDPELRTLLGRRGSARVHEEYSQATMVDRYLALYGLGPVGRA